jgi:hypothetical protein
MVKIAERLITEHVGIAADEAAYPVLRDAVRGELAAYPERQEVFDGRPSVRLRQLERLSECAESACRRTDVSRRNPFGADRQRQNEKRVVRASVRVG